MTLYDAFGRPIEQRKLTEELAGPIQVVREIWTDTVSDRLSPIRLARIIDAARNGEIDDFLTLAADMEEREAHYGSVLETRRLAASSIEADVEAASDSAADVKLADAIRDLIRDPTWEDLVDGLLDALGKGFSVVEIIWDKSGREWRPESYLHRDPRWFRFDHPHSEEIRLKDLEDNMRGIPLAPYKFAVHYPRIRAGLKWSSGLARTAAVNFMLKNYSIKDWWRFMEVYGQPLRIGKYGTEATADEKAILRRAVSMLGTDAAAIIPQSMVIELIRDTAGASGTEIFERATAFIDRQVSKAVLGQTMTTDDGSSYSQSKTHNEVRLDRVAFDTRKLAKTLNRDVVRPFIDLNFGPQKSYPRIRYRVQEPEDLKAFAESITSLVDRGLRVEQSIIRDRFSIPDPEDNAEILVASGPAAPTPTDPALNHAHGANCPHCRALNQQDASQPDDLDEIAADSLADWQPLMEPILGPVEQLAATATDAEDFVAKLPGLLTEINSTELIRALATAAFKARALGDSED